MTNEEIKEKYIQAKAKGFIPDYETMVGIDFKCNQECDNCPASRACGELAEFKEDYEAFKKNYKARIAPLFEGVDNE